MEHKSIKRVGAASLVALHLFSFPAWAQVCSTGNGWGGVFSVLDNGVIDVAAGNTLVSDQCSAVFYNGSTVNANPGRYISSGSASNGKACKDLNADGTVAGYVRASGSPVSAPTLAAFQPSGSDFDVIISNKSQFSYGNTAQNSNQSLPSTAATLTEGSRSVVITKVSGLSNTYSLPGGDYDRIEINSGVSIIFLGPVRLKKLTIQSCEDVAYVKFAQDTGSSSASSSAYVLPTENYVEEIKHEAGCSVKIAGTGLTTLNVWGKNYATGLSTTGEFGYFVGSRSCLNYEPCTPSSTKSYANMDAQHPEYFRLNIYNGNLKAQDSLSVAAGAFVPNGNVILNNGSPTTVVGELLAANVYTQNNDKTQLFHKSTSQAAPRVGAYSLTPPVTELITDKDSLVYRALQKDQPGTSGHLQAFKLKDDSSQNTTADWDAADDSATKMSAVNRLDKLRTETANWANASADFEALSNIASGDTLAQACAVNPTQPACRITGDKRLATSMVGVPWRVAPLLLGDSVLFATDDGILYSVDKTNGNLNWGWIPRAILAESQAALSSTPKKLMEAHPWGQIASVQLLEDDTSSTPAVKVKRTYVTGTALGGKLHFSIRVSNDGKSLSEIVWLDSRTNEYSPGSAGNTNDGEAGYSDGVYGRPYGGAAPLGSVMGGNKVAYVVGGKLVTREVNTSAAAVERNFTTTGSESASSSSAAASSVASSVASSANSSAASAASSITPSSNLLYVDDNSIYFGAADGKVYKAKSSGVIETGEDGVEDVRTYPSGGNASAVWYVNGSKIASASGNGLVLLAQTKTHVTALKYFSDKWSFAWQTGINASTKLGESDPATNPKINVLASDNAYLSAPADIINGVVVLYYTKKPSECEIKGYTFGPLKLLDGTDARGNSQFRMADMTSLDNYVGYGDSTGGAFTRFKGKRAILAGTGGDPSTTGDTAAITPAESAFRERLNWRELTNFF